MPATARAAKGLAGVRAPSWVRLQPPESLLTFGVPSMNGVPVEPLPVLVPIMAGIKLPTPVVGLGVLFVPVPVIGIEGVVAGVPSPIIGTVPRLVGMLPVPVPMVLVPMVLPLVAGAGVSIESSVPS